jgi:GT2 family glycosyltransferase
MPMRVSVIIPHLNQEEHLANCLAALDAQTPVLGVEVEIIVVDNGSVRMPEKVCETVKNVALLREETPGPGPARNRGIKAATGDIISFIDADCCADKDWISVIVASLDLSERPVIGGDVRVNYQTPNHPTFLEPYESIYSYRNEKHIRDGFSGTGNLATFPSVLIDVGNFGGIAISEDRDWGLRARAAGYKTTYVPEMIVYHPARKNFLELTQKWNRHIAHDYKLIRSRRFGVLRWYVRALAVLISPVFELRNILISQRVSGAKERAIAFACLIRIRFFRGWRMLTMPLQRDSERLSNAWNRK